MRRFQVPGQPKNSSTVGFSQKEKRRVAALAIGAVIVLGAFLYSTLRQRHIEEEAELDLPVAEAPTQDSILLPEIDASAIDALVADARPLDRVTLEADAVDALLAPARRLTATQFEVMGEEKLDAEALSPLMQNPSAHRGEPFFARGIVEALRQRRRGTDTEFIGRLRLDDESVCYFLVLDLEDAPENGAYVRVDGLFLKIYSEEDQLESGSWIEAPLLVGPKAERSYRSFGVVDSLPASRFDEVEDADIFSGPEPKIVKVTPFEPLWYLMAYARDLNPDSIDWDAAPELDEALLEEFIRHPGQWRLEPIRIPISRVQDGRVIRAGENPARIASYTQGWMGNWSWQYVIKFMVPHADPSIQLRDYAFGRGFLLQDLAYESAGRGLRVAPLVILSELHRFEPKKEPLWTILGEVFLGSALLMIALFVFLVRRENRRSKVLEEELIRRRRARRSRTTTAGPAGA